MLAGVKKRTCSSSYVHLITYYLAHSNVLAGCLVMQRYNFGRPVPVYTTLTPRYVDQMRCCQASLQLVRSP